ncbi:MAG: GNAT family N-acetyltransferase [Pyrinomonadaceae bacterium]
MQPKIRSLQPADLASVVSLMREFASFENLSDFCTVTVERLDAAMFGDDAVVEGLIAFDDQIPVAYALFYPNFSSFRGQRGLYLEDIYINDKYRGIGLGENMVKEIARMAASRGFERIDFLVLDWNTPAVKFYNKLGAIRDGEERHFKFTDEAFIKLASQDDAF